jgi:hypothetical protein
MVNAKQVFSFSFKLVLLHLLNFSCMTYFTVKAKATRSTCSIDADDITTPLHKGDVVWARRKDHMWYPAVVSQTMYACSVKKVSQNAFWRLTVINRHTCKRSLGHTSVCLSTVIMLLRSQMVFSLCS